MTVMKFTTCLVLLSSLFFVFSSGACNECGVGKFYNTNLADGVVVGCTSCYPGYTCAGGCSDPQPCNVGTFAAGYSATLCDNCVAGSYNLEKAATSCTACPAGYSCATAIAGYSLIFKHTNVYD